MEDDLERYLLARNVPVEDIHRMQRDKIDKAVLQVMSDEQMNKYISTYGDRLAVMTYCRQSQLNTSTNKEILLEKLRSKMLVSKSKKQVTKSQTMARQGNKAGEKSSRRVEIGWLHFNENRLYQVRTKCGGGTRQVVVEKGTTVGQILQMGKDLFFPQNISTKGRAEDFTFDICDFKRKKLSQDSTVGYLYEETRLKIIRFYICTKELKSEASENESRNPTASTPVSPSSSVTATAADSDHDYSTILIQDEFSSDSDKTEDFPIWKKKKRKRTSATVSSPNSLPSQGSYSAPKILLNQDEQDGDDTIEWDPKENLSDSSENGTPVITVNYRTSKEVIQSPGLHEVPIPTGQQETLTCTTQHHVVEVQV